MRTKLNAIFGVFVVIFLCLLFQNINDVSAKVIKENSSGFDILDLKIDQRNRPNIIFRNSKNSKIFYAVKNEKWKTEEIKMPSFEFSAFAIDKNGVPNLLYSNASIFENAVSSKLVLLTRQDNKWKQTLIGNNYGILSCDFEIDKNGGLHIVADSIQNDKSQLTYLFWKNGKMESSYLLDTIEKGIYFATLVLWKDRPSIAYASIGLDDSIAKYASKTGSDWRINTIAQSEFISSPNLFIDNNGAPYIEFGFLLKKLIYWPKNINKNEWKNKTLKHDWTFYSDAGFFDNKNRLHLFTVPIQKGFSDERFGYYEYTKSGDVWKKKLKDETEKISVLSRFIVAKNKAGHVYAAYINKDNNKCNIIYKRLR